MHVQQNNKLASYICVVFNYGLLLGAKNMIRDFHICTVHLDIIKVIY